MAIPDNETPKQHAQSLILAEIFLVFERDYLERGLTLGETRKVLTQALKIRNRLAEKWGYKPLDPKNLIP